MNKSINFSSVTVSPRFWISRTRAGGKVKPWGSEPRHFPHKIYAISSSKLEFGETPAASKTSQALSPYLFPQVQSASWRFSSSFGAASLRRMQSWSMEAEMVIIPLRKMFSFPRLPHQVAILGSGLAFLRSLTDCFFACPLLLLTNPEGSGRRHGFRVFSYREMKAATNNFHSSNKIGEGAFGSVYKVIRPV